MAETIPSQGASESGSIQRPILTCGDLPPGSIEALYAPYELQVSYVPNGQPIPGSHWGPPEAGLIKNTLYLRPDTPVHSALHEGCHYLCMDQARRQNLDTDALGDDLEENGVCYLQILLADHLLEGPTTFVGRHRICQDMDAWGYSFRLGSTRAWFEGDAEDALAWLREHGLVTEAGNVTWRKR